MGFSYQSLQAYLADAGIDPANAGDEAFLLLEAFCGVSRAACLCDKHKVYESETLTKAAEKRARRYPLQYILGKWDFYGMTFAVDERCLIPRPDTEILVDEAIRRLPKDAIFVDLCTGSGCIAISVLARRPDTKAVVLELFPETLALAVKNAEMNGVADRLIPVCGDLLQEGLDKVSAYGPFQAILSNPPYIPAKVVDELAPELFFEPRAALDGGEDGLIFYRDILKRYTALLIPDGQLLMEIGYDQAKALAELGQQYVPQYDFSCLKDLGGLDRAVLFRHPSCTNDII